jgi:hypothetical protein
VFSGSGRGAIRLTLGYPRQLVTPRDTRLRRAGDLIRIIMLDHILLSDDARSVLQTRVAIVRQSSLRFVSSRPAALSPSSMSPPRGTAHASQALLSCPLLFSLQYALRLSGLLS